MKDAKKVSFAAIPAGNRYKMLAVSVCSDVGGMTLQDALSLTLVEAYIAKGWSFDG